MELSHDSRAARRAILALCIFIALILSYQSVQLAISDALVRSDNPANIARGVSLEPGNGDAWDRLGRFHEWDFTNPNPALAASEYLHATQDDPNSARFLMDLASAYEANGEIGLAEQAWSHAWTVYPSSAEVEWNYGNFLLRQENFAEGYALIRQAVTTEPSLLPLAISRTWRASQDIPALLDQALPATPSAYFQALDFFASIGNTDAGLEVWRRIVALHQRIALPQTFPFFQALIEADRSAEARRTWSEAIAAAGLPRENESVPSLVWNGDFSLAIQNGGLGWRWSNPVGANLDFDAPPPGCPGRSVRIDFDGGSNIDLSQPVEYIPVEPDRAYHFRTLIRTQGITTESGLGFLLTDANHDGALNESAGSLTGTNPWTPVDAVFTTGSGTHFLRLCLRRAPSRLFDSKLGGSVWIANVSLVESGVRAEERSK
ncbi:MAG TPA: hypothetical protein VMU43_06360 [Candidatus Acidoferrum sp.]|nr:hypothetical protein [Candidatus Acidoferrum sp.]